MPVPARRAVLTVGVLAVALAIGGATLIPVRADIGPPPIQVALGLDDAADSPAASAAALERRRAVEVARRTTECMAAAGFDHVAEPEVAPEIPDPHLDPVAWAERWGFGISTSIGVAVPENHGRGPSGLTEALRRELYGDARRPGCHERARVEVYGLRDRLLATLSGPLATMHAAIEADRAMVDILEQWQQCVTSGTGASDADRQTFGATVLADLARRASMPLDAEGLERLQAHERRVATALAVCELAYGEARSRVARPYEEAFVASHGPALAAAGAAIRAAESAYPADPGP